MTPLPKTVIDETQTNQLIYCPDLDCFLQITTLQQKDLDAMTADAVAKIATIQNQNATIAQATSTRTAALAAQQVTPPDQEPQS